MIEVKPEQPLNAESPIVVTESPIVTEVNDEQSLNTDTGILPFMRRSLLQYWNAERPIVVIESPNVITANCEQL